MSSPGPVEHVPLKVVPLYAEGENPDLQDRDEEPPELEGVAARVRTPWVGISALALAVVAGVIHGIAVATASAGELDTGTVLAYISIGLSGIAAVAGLFALIGGYGRRTGAAGLVIGVVANPFVLLQLLRWVETLTS